jgi:hypothetical protein
MIIEIVNFTIRPNIVEEDFLKAAAAANVFLSECKGFIRRLTVRYAAN